MCWNTKSFSSVKIIFGIFNFFGCIPLRCTKKSNSLTLNLFWEVVKFLCFLLLCNAMLLYGWFYLHKSNKQDRFTLEEMTRITGHSLMEVMIGHLYAVFSNIVSIGIFVIFCKSHWVSNQCRINFAVGRLQLNFRAFLFPKFSRN